MFHKEELCNKVTVFDYLNIVGYLFSSKLH